MNISFNTEGTSMIPQSEKYKICRQIRQQQVENYLNFLAIEEEDGDGKKKKKKKRKDDQEKAKKGQPKNEKSKAKAKQGKTNTQDKHVAFGFDLCLQSSVEELDEKEVLNAIRSGADFNFVTGNGSSLIHKACLQGCAPVVELLLMGGSNVNCFDDDWWTPLHIACGVDDAEIVQLLLKNGADPTLLDVDGNFPLDHCIQGTETWKVLIQFMEEKDLTEERMKAIQKQACKTMESDIKSSLFLASNLDRPLYDGITLLHIASSNGYIRVVKYLLRKGARVDVIDDAGYIPLHCAVKFNQLKIAELLIKHDSEIDAKGFCGNRVIDLATSDEMQILLLRRGAVEETHESSEEMQENENEYEEIIDPGGSISSKTIYSPGTSMSKADKLTEAKIKMQLSVEENDDEDPYALDTLLKGGDRLSPVDDEKDDEDIYYSSIWKTDMAQEPQLPSRLLTDDLSDLPVVEETTICKTLMERYSSKLIYTNIGEILIAMNPFTSLPLYGKSVSTQFHEDPNPGQSLSPHIYTIAESALRHAMSTHIPQCCVIGGESGSGKTESCKHIVQHILWSVGSSEAELTKKLTQANLVLETFGNAETCMNVNSSRFAKFLTLHLSNTGKVLGGQMNEFLLEKSRVVSHTTGESNFHIFYWMLAGSNPEEMKQCFFDSQTNFRYLVDGVYSSPSPSRLDFKTKFWEVKDCLKFIGFTSEDVNSVMKTLAAILHMGNIEFKQAPHNEDVATIMRDANVQKVSSLLRVSEQDFVSSLLEDVFITRGEQTNKPLTVIQAMDSVDALAKAIYSRLFSWIVNGINQMVQSPVLTDTQPLSIGILDLFGFENLHSNRFEQMCINLANEKLQSFYNNQVFENELRDCINEGVPCLDIVLPGNQEVITMFMGKNTGIFDLLDEESRFPKATDDSLAAKLHSTSGKSYQAVYKSPRYGGPTFTVVHYAGIITYSLNGILNTNRDTLRSALSFVMRGSSDLLVKELFQSQMTHTGSISPSKRQKVSRHLKGAKSAKSAFDFFKNLKKSKKNIDKKRIEPSKKEAVMKRGGNTLTYHFKNSLNELMTRIESSSCHFVRCIKPNKDRKPIEASGDYVLGQLYFTGVNETVRIRKSGFALRATFTQFTKLYPTLIFLSAKDHGGPPDPVAACKALVHAYKIAEFKVGKTKLFMRQREVTRLDELERVTFMKIIKAQTVVRRFLAHLHVKKVRKLQEDNQRELASFTQHMADKQRFILEHLNVLCAEDEKANTWGSEHEYLDMLDNVLDGFCSPVDGSEFQIDDNQQDDYLLPSEYHDQDGGPGVSTETAAGGNTHVSLLGPTPSTASFEFPPPPLPPRPPTFHLPRHPPTRLPPRPPTSGGGKAEEEATAAVTTRRALPPVPVFDEEDAEVQRLTGASDSPEGEMDPSRQYPPSPREMYMYPSAQDANSGMTSPSRRVAPPCLPERKPETQLGNRASRTSSISSRSSSSSEINFEVIPDQPLSPAHGHPHHHQHHYQQQQQQHPQQQQQQQPKGYQDNRPFSYAMGLNPKQQMANMHSPTPVDMRARNHRDASPGGPRGNVVSDGGLLHHYPHSEAGTAMNAAQNGRGDNYNLGTRATQGRPDSAPDIGHGGAMVLKSGAGRNAEGIYGEFVHPPSTSPSNGRPTLTYVPPPVVPPMPQHNGGSQHPSSSSSPNSHVYQQQQQQQQQQQYYQQQQHHRQHHHQYQDSQQYQSSQPTSHNNNNNIYQPSHNKQGSGAHQPHSPSSKHQVAPFQNMIPTPLVGSSLPSPSSPASPKLVKANNKAKAPRDSLSSRPVYPAPPSPVHVQERYTSNFNQARSPSPPLPPPPADSRRSSVRSNASGYFPAPATATSHHTQQVPTAYDHDHHHYHHHHHHQAAVPPHSPVFSHQQTPFSPSLINHRPEYPTSPGGRTPNHQAKAPPRHVPPPPPPPPPPSQMPEPNAYLVRSKLDSNPLRSASPGRPPSSAGQAQQQLLQGVAATADQLAQVKLRSVGDGSPKPNQPPSSQDSGSAFNPANIRLRSAPGTINIYAGGETTALPPTPFDDLDELPPPPPPPELFTADAQGPPSFAPAVAPPAMSSQAVQQPPHHPQSPHHQQHQQQQQQGPPTGMGNSWHSNQPQQPPPNNSHQAGKPAPPQDITTSLSESGSASSSSSTVVYDEFVGIENIIALCVARMDFEIPDDIDLNKCPGLVEITQATPNWRREMIEKKNQDKIEEYVKQMSVQREQEAKWKNVPSWKRKLLQEKDTGPDSTPEKTPVKKTPAQTPGDDLSAKARGDIVPAALSIDPEELAAMPPWKRELLFKRDKVPITFSNEFNPDEEGEEGGEQNDEQS